MDPYEEKDKLNAVVVKFFRSTERENQEGIWKK
jgi:hypothetical protein